MLLRYFYDEKLAHASYLLGCQMTGDAIVIDPGRDVTRYLEVAKAEGVKVVAAAETHIHADYVSGARELGVKHGVKLYLSDEGDENWKYKYVDQVDHQLVKDGDRFKVGNVQFEVWHTPGHTPESISFILTDRGADQPMGIFSGDFVFVGDVGRPDLLEKAAGIEGTAQSGAKDMFHSLERFKQLPDHLQVWPAHGAGSACGKALGAVPSSTVGYEKLFNWALQYTEEDKFVRALLAGQPEPPKYFAVMKRVNKEGPTLLDDLAPVVEMSTEDLKEILAKGEMVIDTRVAKEYAKAHIPGTINIPFNKSFTTWAGWLLDYTKNSYLLADPAKLPDILKALHSVGADQIAGFIPVDSAIQSLETESYPEGTPSELANKIAAHEVTLIDVRNIGEWNAGHIEQAKHMMLGKLPERIAEIPTDKPIVLQCQSGARSAIATSILRAHGIKDVINLLGGYSRWTKEGYPIKQ